MTSRAYRFITLLLGLTGLWACWCRIAMDWDGAYQFALTLIWQEPYKYLSRFHSWVVWLPTVWASRVTTNIKTLEMVFGAPFCFAPLAGFTLSCWVARRHAPHALLWAAFGICLGALPGQAFMINDSIFQMHLFWPVFLAALCPIRVWQRIVIALFGLWQLSHPIGIGLCLIAALVAADSALRSSSAQKGFAVYAVWCAFLSAGGIAKLFLFPDSYAAREASFGGVIVYFWQGVMGWPLLAVGCFWIAAWFAHRLATTSETAPDRSRLSNRAFWFLAFGGAALIFWAADPHRWAKALDYRRWLVPLSLPFFLLAWLEIRRPREMGEAGLRFRGVLGCVAGLIFTAVLGLQSAEWLAMSNRLEAQVQEDAGPVLAPEALAWTKNTVMDHWGTAAMIVAVQSPQPHIIELDTQQLAVLATAEGANLVPLVRDHRLPPQPGPAGWFEFRPLLDRLHRGSSAAAKW